MQRKRTEVAKSTHWKSTHWIDSGVAMVCASGSKRSEELLRANLDGVAEGFRMAANLVQNPANGRSVSSGAGLHGILMWHRLSSMIAILRGVLTEKHPNQAIVDVGGVGYEVTISISTYTGLPDAGREVRLRVHTHVREDTLALYGFLSEDEKILFEKLIGVSGIGPSLAVKVLSGLPTPALVAAIRKGEVERLVQIPGVGKKTAERMVLELRDKVPAPARGDAGPAAPALGSIEQDVLSALLNLGCARPAAETAVRKARADGVPMEFEPLFRRALELVR